MILNLRWAVDPGNSAKPPVLEYQTLRQPGCGWTDWRPVETVAVPRAPAPQAPGLTGGLLPAQRK